MSWWPFPDKSAKTKKRDGGTPDKMSSPIGSAVHIPDELCTGPSVGKVISGDDIDSLAINVDELKKVKEKIKKILFKACFTY